MRLDLHNAVGGETEAFERNVHTSTGKVSNIRLLIFHANLSVDAICL